MRILVTGCSTGLGLATALHLAGRGMQVYASVRQEREAERLAAEAQAHGVTLHVVRLDITDQSSVEAAVQTMTAEVGGIDGLVNNAGIGLRGFFEDCAEEEIRELFEVNVLGTMKVIRAVLPTMRQARSGRIIILTSVAGRAGAIGVSAYCATKFAQEGFGESLAQELWPFGVRVSLIAPDIIQTERWTTNRRYAQRAFSPDSPYLRLFQLSERHADTIVHYSRTRPDAVAVTVYDALTAQEPKMRYMVGRRARLIFFLRRYLPGFEKGMILNPIRRITREAGIE